MSIAIAILIVLACIVLAFFILVQNPKGGGLAGSFGSLGSQVMGVQQSTDVMEKGTWYTMALIALLSIGAVGTYAKFKQTTAPAQRSAPAQQQQAPAAGTPAGTPAPAAGAPAPAPATPAPAPAAPAQ